MTPEVRRTPAPRRGAAARRSVRRVLRLRSAARRQRYGVVLLLTVVAASGCGIRATTVPVDASPAPSRVACSVEGGSAAQKSPVPEAQVVGEGRVALVCSGRVVDVRRELELTEGESMTNRLSTARTLLAELRRNPSTLEEEAGFTTKVPDDLQVSGPNREDDSTALRLSEHPADLPSFTLAQIVCTFADTALADTNRQVLLGGPSDEPNKPLKLYECGTALRTTAEAAETAGVPF